MIISWPVSLIFSNVECFCFTGSWQSGKPWIIVSRRAISPESFGEVVKANSRVKDAWNNWQVILWKEIGGAIIAAGCATFVLSLFSRHEPVLNSNSSRPLVQSQPFITHSVRHHLRSDLAWSDEISKTWESISISWAFSIGPSRSDNQTTAAEWLYIATSPTAKSKTTSRPPSNQLEKSPKLVNCLKSVTSPHKLRDLAFRLAEAASNARRGVFGCQHCNRGGDCVGGQSSHFY